MRSATLINNGYVYARRLDIKKYFDNFEHDAMSASSLGIGANLIEYVILGKHHNYDVDSSHFMGNEAAPIQPYSLVGHKGIPQGSAASQMIADIAISRMKFVMPDETNVINYVDDFLVLSKESDALDKAEKTLRSAVAELPFGKFELLEKSSGSNTFSADGSPASYRFLGHVLTASKEGEVIVDVDDANIHKIGVELAGLCIDMEAELNKLSGHKIYREEAKYHAVGIAHRNLCWLRTFDQATEINGLSEELFVYLDTAIAELPFLDREELISIVKKLSHKDAPIY